MIPLALPDDAASVHAYTPSVLVKHEASASTSGSNDRIPPRLALAATPRSASAAAYATREFVDMVDPIGELVREIFNKADATRQATSAYQERIIELINDAALNGISLNKASEGDFWTFLMAQNFFWKSKLFLLDNGNLRAVWKSEMGDQIGLQFLGSGAIQYVIFKHRPRAANVSRVAGRDTLDGVRGQISALGLDNLIAA